MNPFEPVGETAGMHVSLWECMACFAVVTDKNSHLKWHARLDQLGT